MGKHIVQINFKFCCTSIIVYLKEKNRLKLAAASTILKFLDYFVLKSKVQVLAS